MKILVTGGTGFLGSRLLPKLVQAGHEVFALTRSPGSHLALRALGVLPVDTDLDSAKPLALPTIDAVVHAAAMFRFSGPREPYFRTNVDGTVALLAASEKAGAKRFIFMSAAGIVMDEAGHPTNEVDESAPTFPNHFSAYLASKAQAEALVLAADKPTLRTITLRPAAIWGPGDPFSRAFIASLAAVQGLSVDKLHSMPYWLAAIIGRSMDSGWSLMRREDDPPISRSMMRMIGREFSINDNAARLELGYVGRTSRADGLRGYEVCEAS